VLDPATECPGNQLTPNTAEGEETPTPSQPSAQQFVGESDHFSRAVRDGIEILTPASMGLRDMRLLEAIYLSAERGEWVEMNPDGTPDPTRTPRSDFYPHGEESISMETLMLQMAGAVRQYAGQGRACLTVRRGR
jgi:hypothetical protein